MQFCNYLGSTMVILPAAMFDKTFMFGKQKLVLKSKRLEEK